MSVGFKTDERESVVLDVDMSLEVKCDMLIGNVGAPLPPCPHPAHWWTYWHCPGLACGNMRIATCEICMNIIMSDLAKQAKGILNISHAGCGLKLRFVRAKGMK